MTEIQRGFLQNKIEGEPRLNYKIDFLKYNLYFVICESLKIAVKSIFASIGEWVVCRL